jgi:hypothetical protein
MMGIPKHRLLALVTALGVAAAVAAPVQAVNFGDMMNPGKWMGGKKDRDDLPPPGYGYGQGPYGAPPPGGYYGQPAGPGYGGGYPGGGAYPGGAYPGGAGAYPGGAYPGGGYDPYQQGYGGAAPAYPAPTYSAPAATPSSTGDTSSDEKIRRLERRIQQLEQERMQR